MKFAARLAAHFALASLFTLVMAGQTTPSPSPVAPDQATSQEQTAQLTIPKADRAAGALAVKFG